MFINKLKKILNKNKKIFVYTWLFLVLFCFSSDLAFAATGETYSEQDAVNFLIMIINVIYWIAAAVLWAVTALVSWFLTPEWYNWEVFNLWTLLKSLWILISNIVYFIFAVILIVIAFMNILWKWDQWELKQALPRFVVWVLIVPISRFLVQFVLSLSAILTTSVLTLPYDMVTSWTMGITIPDIEIETDYILNLWSEETNTTDICATETLTDQLFVSCDKKSIKSIMEWTVSKTTWEFEWGLENSVFGIVSIYTYWIMSLDKVETLAATDVTNKNITKISQLFWKWLIDVIFLLVYLILMIALFLALFTRWVMLWIYAIFSPAFGLLFFFKKWSEWVWDWEMKFSIKEFVSLAMVPVYVSAALSFWLIFIFAVRESMMNVAWATDNGDLCLPSVWEFKFCIAWTVWAATDKVITAWLSTVWTVILQIFGIVILWVWVMTALKQSNITKNMIEPIETFWKNVWGLVLKSPQYAPIIPTWAGGMQSVSSVSKMSWMVKSSFESWSSDKAQKLFDKTPFSNALVNASNSLQKVADHLRQNELWPNEIAKKAKEILKTTNWDKKALLTSWWKAALVALLTEAGIKEEKSWIKWVESINSMSDVEKVFKSLRENNAAYEDLPYTLNKIEDYIESHKQDDTSKDDNDVEIDEKAIAIEKVIEGWIVKYTVETDWTKKVIPIKQGEFNWDEAKWFAEIIASRIKKSEFSEDDLKRTMSSLDANDKSDFEKLIKWIFTESEYKDDSILDIINKNNKKSDNNDWAPKDKSK